MDAYTYVKIHSHILTAATLTFNHKHTQSIPNCCHDRCTIILVMLYRLTCSDQIETICAPRILKAVVTQKTIIPKTNKQGIYEALKAKISDSAIMSTYSINGHQLAAHKAWLTMWGQW